MPIKIDTMLGIDALKRAWSIIVHPGRVSKTMEPVQALKFFYKVAAIPLIISIIIAGALALVTGAATAAIAVILVLLGVLVYIPISIVVSAAIYHFFAKVLFHVWHQPFKYTMTAVLYGVLPELLFIWLSVIPVVGRIILIVLAIWSFIVLIISIARQQRVSGWRAFGGILIPVAIGFLVILGILFLLFLVGFLLGSGTLSSLGATCLALPGYACTSVSYSSGYLTVTVAQVTGNNWASVDLAFVPAGTNATTASYVPVAGGMASGAPVTVSLPVGMHSGSSAISGAIWASYKLTTSQAAPYTAEIATATT